MDESDPSTVALRDGRTLAYAEYGAPDGPRCSPLTASSVPGYSGRSVTTPGTRDHADPFDEAVLDATKSVPGVARGARPTTSRWSAATGGSTPGSSPSESTCTTAVPTRP
jgi:hypothetical protein